MIFPLLFVVYCWLCYAAPWLFLWNGIHRNTNQQNTRHLHTSDINLIESILGLPQNSISVSMLENFRHTVSHPRTVTHRFLKFLWYCSILGITISIIPAITHLYPFIEPLIYLLNRIKVVYEITAYYICSRFLVFAFNSRHPYRSLIALTGLLLALPALYLSSIVANVSYEPYYYGLFFFLTSLPFTYVFNSHLIGFFTTASIFQIAGFLVMPIGGGYLIGFTDMVSAQNVLMTSIVMICLYILDEALEIRLSELFHIGMVIFGPIAFGISGLIICDDVTNKFSTLLNIAYVFTLFGFVILGYFSYRDSLSNVSIVFLVIWALDKLFFYVQGYSWLIIFATSCIVWQYSRRST
jgi:hypothetical protein